MKTASRRGDELATPDIAATTRHLAKLRVLGDAVAALRHRQFVRVHLGAIRSRRDPRGSARCPLVSRDSPSSAAGSRSWRYGQPFVIRQLSPAGTIGSGTIISPATTPTDRQARLEAASALGGDDAAERLFAYIDLRRGPFDEASESSIGLDQEACRVALAATAETEANRAASAALRAAFTSPPSGFSSSNEVVVAAKAELARRRPACRFRCRRSCPRSSTRPVRMFYDTALDDLIAEGNHPAAIASDCPAGPIFPTGSGRFWTGS
ncbi:MAG: hypothetical protein U0992_13710 [Planctomycetaceae bacterium]